MQLLTRLLLHETQPCKKPSCMAPWMHPTASHHIHPGQWSQPLSAPRETPLGPHHGHLRWPGTDIAALKKKGIKLKISESRNALPGAGSSPEPRSLPELKSKPEIKRHWF